MDKDNDELLDDEQLYATTCTGCSHQEECEKRSENDPHIYEAQFLHCNEVLGRADFHEDKDWIFSFGEEGEEKNDSSSPSL
jgi:hypothetical protein